MVATAHRYHYMYSVMASVWGDVAHIWSLNTIHTDEQ